jgi:hypothetical protein
MSYLEDNPTSRKNLETYLKSHFSKVNNLIAESYLPGGKTEIIDIFGHSYDRVLLTNNSIIPNIGEFYNGLGWWDKKVLEEVFISKHLPSEYTRTPNRFITNITYSSYEQFDPHYFRKCTCFQDRLFFDYINFIEILDKNVFWNEYSLSDIQDTDGYGFLRSSYFEESEENTVYVKLDLYPRIESDVYKGHSDKLIYGKWGNRIMGGVGNKKADYFLLLAESDAIKFSDTFDKWKNNKK